MSTSRANQQTRREILAKIEHKMSKNLPDTSNQFVVGRWSGPCIIIQAWPRLGPPGVPPVLSTADALNLAVWLANLADPGLAKFHAMSEAINQVNQG